MRPTAQLRRLYKQAGNVDAISIRSIVSTLGVNSFALLLLLFAVLSTMLTPIPGQAMVQSIPMMILAYQWLRGDRAVKLPPRAAAQTVPTRHFRRALKKVLPILVWLEKFSHRRGRQLMSPKIRNMERVVILLLCGCVALPIPLTHIPPDIVLVIITIGELQEDAYMEITGAVIGLLILCGYVVAGMLLISGLL